MTAIFVIALVFSSSLVLSAYVTKQAFKDAECTKPDNDYVEVFEDGLCYKDDDDSSTMYSCSGSNATILIGCPVGDCSRTWKCMGHDSYRLGECVADFLGSYIYTCVSSFPKVNPGGYYNHWYGNHNCNGDIHHSQVYVNGTTCYKSIGLGWMEIKCDSQGNYWEYRFGTQNPQCSGPPVEKGKSVPKCLWSNFSPEGSLVKCP